MMDHTPGPWNLAPAGRIERYDPPGKPGFVMHICHVCSDDDGITVDKEAAANARLIAAAPALLNSVIEALQQFGFESWDDSRMACIARMRKTLRLAIAASDEDLENNGCLR
jgi:hypothetical protein